MLFAEFPPITLMFTDIIWLNLSGVQLSKYFRDASEAARKWVLRLQGSSKFVDATIWSKVPPAKNILLLKVTRCGGEARTHALTHTHSHPHARTHAHTHSTLGEIESFFPFDFWRQNQNQNQDSSFRAILQSLLSRPGLEPGIFWCDSFIVLLTICRLLYALVFVSRETDTD